MGLTTSTTVWEVRTAGSDLNGGGFNTAAAGTDRSQSDTPFVTIDGVTITATVAATTTDLTLTGYTAVAADVGNLVNISGGTATAGVYEIKSLPGGNAWRLDRAAGTAGQTATGRMGGANATPGWVAGKVVDANIVWIKAGTYAITSTTANIAGGRVSAPRGTWIGYQTTRNDFGTAPVLQASGINTFTLFTSAGNELIVANLTCDGALQAATRGWSFGNRCFIFRCSAINCTNNGFSGGTSSGTEVVECVATGCTTQPAFDLSNGTESVMHACRASGNTVTGFLVGQATCVRCASYANTGATSHGFSVNRGIAINCVAYGNGGDGFTTPGGAGNEYINCAAEANTGVGFRASVAGVAASGEVRINCAATLNTAGPTNGSFRLDLGFITGAASFFIDPATGNFALNNLATGGFLLKNAGSPTTIGGTTPFFNIGLAQATAFPTGGGGGQAIIGPGAPGWVL